MAIVRQAVRFPITVLVLTVALLAGVFIAYGKYGAGVEFFPNVEPDYGLLYVHARGNLSLAEMDVATKAAEDRLLGWPGVKSVYTRVGKTQGGGQDVPEDVVGVIQYEFVDWRERKAANQILDELRGVMAGIPGVDVEVRVPEAGPPTGKAIQVQAFRRRSGRARQEGEGCRGAHRPGSRRHRHLGRPAAARRRLGHPGRPRQGGAIRRQSDRRSAPRSSSSPTG